MLRLAAVCLVCAVIGGLGEMMNVEGTRSKTTAMSQVVCVGINHGVIGRSPIKPPPTAHVSCAWANRQRVVCAPGVSAGLGQSLERGAGSPQVKDHVHARGGFCTSKIVRPRYPRLQAVDRPRPHDQSTCWWEALRRRRRPIRRVSGRACLSRDKQRGAWPT